MTIELLRTPEPPQPSDYAVKEMQFLRRLNDVLRLWNALKKGNDPKGDCEALQDACEYLDITILALQDVGKDADE